MAWGKEEKYKERRVGKMKGEQIRSNAQSGSDDQSLTQRKLAAINAASPRQCEDTDTILRDKAS